MGYYENVKSIVVLIIFQAVAFSRLSISLLTVNSNTTTEWEGVLF